jgi:hypothetical protein
MHPPCGVGKLRRTANHGGSPEKVSTMGGRGKGSSATMRRCQVPSGTTCKVWHPSSSGHSPPSESSVSKRTRAWVSLRAAAFPLETSCSTAARSSTLRRGGDHGRFAVGRGAMRSRSLCRRCSKSFRLRSLAFVFWNRGHLGARSRPRPDGVRVEWEEQFIPIRMPYLKQFSPMQFDGGLQPCLSASCRQ